MKAVLTSIQPYYVFLIITRLMGWDIPQEKTIEVRKDYPKDSEWNKVTHIYCSKNRKSFNRIPKQYQPFMAKLLGKVVGEFVCDNIYTIKRSCNGFMIDNDIALTNRIARESCLQFDDLQIYLGKKDGYAWHISDLKIYDKPKELGEFRKPCKFKKTSFICPMLYPYYEYESPESANCLKPPLRRPSQSWCYVEA